MLSGTEVVILILKRCPLTLSTVKPEKAVLMLLQQERIPPRPTNPAQQLDICVSSLFKWKPQELLILNIPLVESFGAMVPCACGDINVDRNLGELRTHTTPVLTERVVENPQSKPVPNPQARQPSPPELFRELLRNKFPPYNLRCYKEVRLTLLFRPIFSPLKSTLHRVYVCVPSIPLQQLHLHPLFPPVVCVRLHPLQHLTLPRQGTGPNLFTLCLVNPLTLI